MSITRKQTTYAAVSLTAAIAFAGICTTYGEAQNSLPPVIAAASATSAAITLKNADNKAGTSMFATMARQQSRGNIVLSPLSLSMALQMEANAAAGDTRKELLRTFGFNPMNLNKVNNANQRYLQDVAAKSSTGQTLEIANGLFTQDKIQLNPSFVELCQKYYGGLATEVNFSDISGINRVNAWVSEKTHHLISSIIDGPASDLQLALINTVYFKGTWKYAFDKANTRDSVFHNQSGDHTVPMMSRHFKKVQYLENGDAQVISLPYQPKEGLKPGGRSMRMLVILPHKDRFDRLAGRMTPAWFEVLDSKMQDCEGHLTMPRFKVSFKTSAKSTLMALGIRKAFNSEQADFSAAAPKARGIFISEVLHNTVLDVNEEGTEAAAATAVTTRALSVDPASFRMSVDRPFYLAIEDDIGTLLFLGRINEL